MLVDEDWVEVVRRRLAARLPDEFLGLPTRFATTWDQARTVRVEDGRVLDDERD